MSKERIDVLLVEQGFFDSREKAKRSIMAGLILVDGAVVDKAGAKIDRAATLTVKGSSLPYVSRGGLKLAKALEVFPIDPSGKVAMDIGASTGGFTDCLLQNGASKVYAVDVGYGQLAWSLRQDPRVVVMERTNIRYLEPELVAEQIEFVTIDVSFISLTKIANQVKLFLAPDAVVVALIKPQFEAGPEKVGKNGVVRDQAVHQEVIEQVTAYFTATGLRVCGLDYSPVKGPQGNIEYLLYAVNNAAAEESFSLGRIVETVVCAHRELDKNKGDN